MSAKVLLINLILLKYLESKHLTETCFSSGMSPSWSEQGSMGVHTVQQLLPAGSGQTGQTL